MKTEVERMIARSKKLKIEKNKYFRQAPADISFQIKNDELSTENREIYRIVQSIEGVSPYRAPKR